MKLSIPFKKWALLCIGLSAVLVVCSCSKSSSGVSIVPDIRSMVNDATPAGLQPSAASRAGLRTAQSVLLEFYRNTVAGISGTSGTGIIDSALVDLKYRYDELNTRFTSAPACASATPVDWTVTVGAPVGQTMTLKIQCKDIFSQSGGDQSGAGSGIAWGTDNGHFYLALILVQSNGVDKFGYFADVVEATKEVDLLYLESFATTTTRSKFFRLLADASDSSSTAKSYQLTYSSSSESGVGPSGSNGSLGCGARLLSDGTEVLADGTTGMTNSSGACSGSSAFTNTNCYNGADPSTAAAACSSLTTADFNSKIAIVTAADTVSMDTTISGQLSFDSISAVTESVP